MIEGPVKKTSYDEELRITWKQVFYQRKQGGALTIDISMSSVNGWRLKEVYNPSMGSKGSIRNKGGWFLTYGNPKEGGKEYPIDVPTLKKYGFNEKGVAVCLHQAGALEDALMVFPSVESFIASEKAAEQAVKQAQARASKEAWDTKVNARESAKTKGLAIKAQLEASFPVGSILCEGDKQHGPIMSVRYSLGTVFVVHKRRDGTEVHKSFGLGSPEWYSC